jgi:hypothetical protein
MTEGSLYRVYLNSSNELLAPVGGFRVHLNKFRFASLPRYRSMKLHTYHLELSPIPALLSVLVVTCKLHVRLFCLLPRGRSSPAGVCTAERYSLSGKGSARKYRKWHGTTGNTYFDCRNEIL